MFVQRSFEPNATSTTTTTTTTNNRQGVGVTLRPHDSGWTSLNQSDQGQSVLSDRFSRHYATLTAGHAIDLEVPFSSLVSIDLVWLLV